MAMGWSWEGDRMGMETRVMNIPIQRRREL